jgi:hypothetical protein
MESIFLGVLLAKCFCGQRLFSSQSRIAHTGGAWK